MAPNTGPTSSPIPDDDSIIPIVLSLSFRKNDEIIENDAVAFIPAPKPFNSFQQKEKTIKYALLSTYFNDPKPNIDII